jgi:CubicO group peptidase (beta-lactamase class C family)
VLLLAIGVPAQTAIPDTPAGKVFNAWIEAFNSADPAKLRAFDETYRTKPSPGTMNFRDQTGGFALVRVEKSEPSLLVALLQERDSDTLVRLEMRVAGDPPKMLDSPIRTVPRPADLAIARLSERELFAATTMRMDALAAADRFSGAVMVARHGKVLFQKAAGKANRETGAPVTVDTQFRNGSMNKMFTAVAALQLVDAGKIGFDDPIGKHLTGYPNADLASKVTVRHLLTHSGGTGDIFGPEFERNRDTLREHADYLKLYGARGLTHEPGAEFRYSNYGFVLLGALIERVSGMSYYDYVRANVFEPAGMKNTDSLPESEKVPDRSLGYLRLDGRWLPNTDTLPWRGTSAGGGYSTVGDFTKFAHALESGKLVSKALYAEATRVQKDRYGFGFQIDGDGALRSYGHGGGAPGMNGDLRIYPELGYVIIGLSNLDPPAASRVVSFIANRLPVAASTTLAR